jgi:membrane protein
MVLVLLAVFGFIYGNSEVARREILHQLYSFLDRSSAKAVEDIATSAGKPTASALATVVGIAVALFGASGVFGQLQEALNTIWGVKPKPGRSLISFLRARFLSFAMVAGMCFLLLVSLTASAVITAVGGYLEHLLPGGSVLAWTVHLVLDISIVTLLFAMIFKFLPDARLAWRDVRLGAALTTALFLVGKYALGLYLDSGAPGSAYGAAGSLITMLIWIYYAAQNRALRRRVYSSLRPGTRPRHSSGQACRARRSKGNRVTTVDRSGRQVIELQHINLLRKDSFGRMPEECVWLRSPPRSYPKDITKHKQAARKKTSLNTSSPVDQRLHLIACCRCPAMTLSRSAMSG